MLQITPKGNIVTENPNNYYSINIERAEVAHMVNGKIKSYINCLSNKELKIFMTEQTFEKIEDHYNSFSVYTYEHIHMEKIIEPIKKEEEMINVEDIPF